MSATRLTQAFERMADEIYVETLEGSVVIGRDQHGMTHTYHPEQDAVVVHYGRQLDDYHYLHGHTLDAWVQNVRDKRGWVSPGPEGDRLIDADKRLKEGQ